MDNFWNGFEKRATGEVGRFAGQLWNGAKKVVAEPMKAGKSLVNAGKKAIGAEVDAFKKVTTKSTSDSLKAPALKSALRAQDYARASSANMRAAAGKSLPAKTPGNLQ